MRRNALSSEKKLQEERRLVAPVLARRDFVRYLLEHDAGAVEDVRGNLCFPEESRPCLPSVPRHLAQLGLIEKCGARKSRRPASCGHRVRCWRIADRGAAEKWLQETSLALRRGTWLKKG